MFNERYSSGYDDAMKKAEDVLRQALDNLE